LIVEVVRNEIDERYDYDNMVETLVNTVIEEFHFEKITCTAYAYISSMSDKICYKKKNSGERRNNA